MKQQVLTRNKQRGISLLESLIAILLCSISILGASYAIARMLHTQQENNLRYIVTNQLLETLRGTTYSQKNAWCNGTSQFSILIPKDETRTNVKVVCRTMIVTVNGTSNNKSINISQPIKFELENPRLGGKVTVGENFE